ncbi:hypothetical protein V2J09_003692 [Rumex salicifolius]
MGLNDSFSVIRGNVLMINPPPSLDDVYNFVLQEEEQRSIRSPESHFEEDGTALISRGGGSSRRGGSSGGRSYFCDHCKRSGHTVDRCYRLHGYPNRDLPNDSNREQHRSSSRDQRVAATSSEQASSPTSPSTLLNQVTKREAQDSEWLSWKWRSENDLFLAGAQLGSSLMNNPYQHDMIPSQPGDDVKHLARFAGPLKCNPNEAC